MNVVGEPITRDENGARLLGKIPVKNLWLLMLYASVLYRLKRNLSFGYESRVAVLGRGRGRIDSLYTERHRLLEKGKVCCRLEELTVDTPRNRYVRSALEKLTSILSSTSLIRRCRSLVISLDQLGVKQGKPIAYNGKSERFGRHDMADQKMVAAADLAFSLALPAELVGRHHLTMPDKQVHWLRKLFEKAIAGFYSVALSPSEWKVSAGRQFRWKILGKTTGIDAILPMMKTDIVIDHLPSGRRLVIDTKFNSVTTKGWYRDESLRSAYVYQMYAYLRSQEDFEQPLSMVTSGMLLHPSIDRDVNERVTIQGHSLAFCTVNLGSDATNIRAQLLSLIFNSD